MQTDRKLRLAILASGNGSNAEKLIRYFAGHANIQIALIVSNNPKAFVLQRAKKCFVDSVVITRAQWENKKLVKSIFAGHQIDAIVLAGYLLLIPGWFLKMYPGRILNIHPALLPDFGGKGMYGMHVHRAVISSGADKSGISIHIVNENYDEGSLIFQKSLNILPGDTPESLAKRVLELEHRYYPRIVEHYFLDKTLPTE